MRRDDARGERRRVERVLGVQDHRHVERRHHGEFGRLAERLPEEVRREAEVGAGLDELELVPAPLVVGDDRRQLREQPQRLVEVRLGRVVGGGRVARADDADTAVRTTSIGWAVSGNSSMIALGDVVESAQRPLALLEHRELGVVGQLAVPQQVGDLFEGARRGELLHGVAAVEQRVRVGVDLRDGGVVDEYAGQALVDQRGRRRGLGLWCGALLGHGCSLANRRQRAMVKLKIDVSKWL